MSDVTRLVDELTTLLYEVLKRWEVQGRVCEIVMCGACRKKADKPASVVHESDCPVHRLWQAMEVAEVVVKANAEEICDLEDERDALEAKVNALTAEMECRNELLSRLTHAQNAVMLLNSMVLSGESHSDGSRALVRAALGKDGGARDE